MKSKKNGLNASAPKQNAKPASKKRKTDEKVLAALSDDDLGKISGGVSACNPAAPPPIPMPYPNVSRR
jgi:hypothetical protein